MVERRQPRGSRRPLRGSDGRRSAGDAAGARPRSDGFGRAPAGGSADRADRGRVVQRRVAEGRAGWRDRPGARADAPGDRRGIGRHQRADRGADDPGPADDAGHRVRAPATTSRTRTVPTPTAPQPEPPAPGTARDRPRPSRPRAKPAGTARSQAARPGRATARSPAGRRAGGHLRHRSQPTGRARIHAAVVADRRTGRRRGDPRLPELAGRGVLPLSLERPDNTGWYLYRTWYDPAICRSVVALLASLLARGAGTIALGIVAGCAVSADRGRPADPRRRHRLRSRQGTWLATTAIAVGLAAVLLIVLRPRSWPLEPVPPPPPRLIAVGGIGPDAGEPVHPAQRRHLVLHVTPLAVLDPIVAVALAWSALAAVDARTRTVVDRGRGDLLGDRHRRRDSGLDRGPLGRRLPHRRVRQRPDRDRRPHQPVRRLPSHP